MQVSQNEAGDRAGISGTRWRQIVNTQASDMTSTRGVKTIARMATVVGVTAEAFAGVGRSDIADLLREHTAPPTVEELTERVERLEQAQARDREENSELRRMLREITSKDSGGSGSLKGESGRDEPRQAM